jgi:hypothetical protein
VAKHVTWSGLPPIEEDEKRVRKVLGKDAPKGAEQLNDPDPEVASK